VASANPEWLSSLPNSCVQFHPTFWSVLLYATIWQAFFLSLLF
jgi:hypothetical protein